MSSVIRLPEESRTLMLMERDAPAAPIVARPDPLAVHKAAEGTPTFTCSVRGDPDTAAPANSTLSLALPEVVGVSATSYNPVALAPTALTVPTTAGEEVVSEVSVTAIEAASLVKL